MKKKRLSLNQADALFVLAYIETKNINEKTPVSKIREMISQSRPNDVDPSNFRKSIHELDKKGCIELFRANDLSLAAKLTKEGRRHAAKIYRERTGKELDVLPQSNEQITIFDEQGLHER